MGVTNFDAVTTTGDVTVGGNLAVTGTIPSASLDTGKAEETLHFFGSGAQSTGTLKNAMLMGVACTIVDVRARILTAPVGSAFIVDVNKNGTTVFSTQGNRPTVADGANVSSTTAPDVTAVAAGDYLSYDIDQIGSGTAGSNLMVSITVKRALVA